MEQLHPALLASQALLPHDTPVHLVTRHSIREQPDNQFADGSVPLTDEGRALAYAWGEHLQKPIMALYSSPIGRCVETAELMLAGSLAKQVTPQALPLQQTTALVEPGCFVTDIFAAGEYFFQLGARGFINQYLTDTIPGVLTPSEGVSKLATYLYYHQSQAGGLALHVTHDTVLAAFVYALKGSKSIQAADWPWMLEGLWCWFSAQGLHWVWRGEAGLLPLEFHEQSGHLMAQL